VWSGVVFPSSVCIRVGLSEPGHLAMPFRMDLAHVRRWFVSRVGAWAVPGLLVRGLVSRGIGPRPVPRLIRRVVYGPGARPGRLSPPVPRARPVPRDRTPSSPSPRSPRPIRRLVYGSWARPVPLPPRPPGPVSPLGNGPSSPPPVSSLSSPSLGPCLACGVGLRHLWATGQGFLCLGTQGFLFVLG
jgi:hypothetical protein